MSSEHTLDGATQRLSPAVVEESCSVTLENTRENRLDSRPQGLVDELL